jgi:GAF domain-containing protein
MSIHPIVPSIAGAGVYIHSFGVGISLFAILYAVFSLLAYRTRPGIYIGFQFSAAVASYLALGPIAVVLTSAIGAILAEVGQHVFRSWLNQPKHSIYETLSLPFFNASFHSALTLLSTLVYLLLGGMLPIEPGQPTLAIPVGGMLVVNQALQSLAVLLIMRWRGQIVDFSRVKESAFILFSSACFSMTTAALLPVAYYELPPFPFLALAGVAVLLALLFRVFEQSQRALERRVEEMATLNSIGQSISSSLAMSDLMQGLYQQISRLMEVHAFYVALYTGDMPRVLTFPFAVRNGQRVAIEAVPNIYGVVEHITSTRSPLLIRGPVNAELLKLGIQPTEPDDSLCFLGVPLIVDDEVTGMLGLYNHARPDAYRPSDVGVLSAIAAQAAIALHNASLYNRVWEMADELALLNNVSSVVTATLDLHIVLDTTCAVVIQIGHADKTAIFLISEDGQTLQLVHSTGLSENYVAQFRRRYTSTRRWPSRMCAPIRAAWAGEPWPRSKVTWACSRFRWSPTIR